MDLDSRSLRLVDWIYRSASEPAHWHEFAEELSRACDGAAVALGLRLRAPRADQHHFTAGLNEKFGVSLLTTFLHDLPSDPDRMASFTRRFATLDEAYPGLKIARTDFYRDWMRPRGLAPLWPMLHVLTLEGEIAPAALVVFRKQRGEAFSRAELDMANGLVPHLKRAFEIYESLSSLHHERRALEEVIDRLRVGVVLIDSAKRPVLMNRSAQMLIELGETLAVDAGRIRARDAADQVMLNAALDRASATSAWSAIHLRETTHAELQVLVNPLTAAPAGSRERDAVAALFISGRETFSGLSLRYLRSAFGLTSAESELVAGLVDGASLEQAAAERGVSLNTVRSQLKQVFQKTGTRRQSEVVSLVLTGLSSVQEV